MLTQYSSHLIFCILLQSKLNWQRGALIGPYFHLCIVIIDEWQVGKICLFCLFTYSLNYGYICLFSLHFLACSILVTELTGVLSLFYAYQSVFLMKTCVFMQVWSFSSL